MGIVDAAPGAFDYTAIPPVELDDETLRDGLQSPSVQDPPIGAKIEILHLMDGLGIHTADIGLPGAGPRAERDVRALAREIASARLRIAANCAARTVRADIEPIARKYSELRYQLMPYTYTLAWEARTAGLPLMRALWLHYPDDQRARSTGDQFLWGRDLMIAPVYAKGATTRLKLSSWRRRSTLASAPARLARAWL